MSTTLTALEAALQDALRYFPDDLSDEQRLLLQEDLRLQFEYPGQFVAYLDVWEEWNGIASLTRQVLHAGSSFQDVWDATRGHPQSKDVVCGYVDDPAAALEPIVAD